MLGISGWASLQCFVLSSLHYSFMVQLPLTWSSSLMYPYDALMEAFLCDYTSLASTPALTDEFLEVSPRRRVLAGILLM